MPRTAIGTETIAATSPAERSDPEEDVVVGVGLAVIVDTGLTIVVDVELAVVVNIVARVEAGDGFVVENTVKSGVTDVASPSHQLLARTITVNLPVVEVGLEASLSLVTVNTSPPSTQ